MAVKSENDIHYFLDTRYLMRSDKIITCGNLLCVSHEVYTRSSSVLVVVIVSFTVKPAQSPLFMDKDLNQVHSLES